LNWSRIDRCARSTKGFDLLIRNVESMSLYFEKSWSQVPSVYMDGRPYNPRAGHDTSNIIAALCFVFHYPADSISFPWWVFAFMLGIAAVIIIMFWVIRNGRPTFGNAVCRTFFDVPEEDDEAQNQADEALRRWQAGELARSFSEESDFEGSDDEFRRAVEASNADGTDHRGDNSSPQRDSINGNSRGSSRRGDSGEDKDSDDDFAFNPNDSWTPADEMDAPLISASKLTSSSAKL